MEFSAQVRTWPVYPIEELVQNRRLQESNLGEKGRISRLGCRIVRERCIRDENVDASSRLGRVRLDRVVQKGSSCTQRERVRGTVESGIN